MRRLLLFLLCVEINAFIPLSNRVISKIDLNRRLRFSSTIPSSLVSYVNSKFDASVEITNEMSQKQEVARAALMKLLERQRKEMKQTEELIENLISDDINLDSNATSTHHASSIAASLLSGYDYGFVSRSEGCRFENVQDINEQLFTGYGPPANMFSLGSQQFMRNMNAMRGEYNDESDDVELTSNQKKLRGKLKELTLNSTAIWEREKSRGPIVAPLIIKVPYIVLCFLLDVVFEGQYVPSRFFLLETVARMPYFSYIAMLHLYETLGFWRRSKDVKRVHFAEEWNEFHHLLIMESLGGDQKWWVRFMAQHSAIVYYFGLSLLWMISPSLSYKFSELLETHAVDTYGEFLDENEELLKKLPPSLAAVEYYTVGVSDPMFGEYQTSALATGIDIRKPGTSMKSLYDVFMAIRADEGDHVGTMKACLDPNIAVMSPSLETRFLTGVALSTMIGYFLSTGALVDIMDPTEITENIDESMPLTETAFQSLLGGLASLLQGLKEIESDGAIIENESFVSTSLDAIVPVLKQGIVSLLEALGLLGL